MKRTPFALGLAVAGFAPSSFALVSKPLPESGSFGLLVAGLVAGAVVTLRRRRK